MPVQTQMQVRRGTASSWTSTNPTLAAGELGFETDTGKFKIGTGSSTWTALPYAGGGAQATFTTYQYTATAAQTTFSGVDANGNTLAYTAGSVQVYLNGALLQDTADYAATNGTSVVLTTGALVGDSLTVIALGTFTVSTDIPKSTLTAKGSIVAASAASTPANLSVGADGTVLTADSTEATGLKWEAPASGVTTFTLRKAYTTGAKGTTGFAFNGTNLYVAVGQDGNLFSSSDAITWTSRTSGFGTQTINSVAYGAGIFVAVGYNGLITTSTDGITWTSRTSGMSTNRIIRVRYLNNTQFIAVGAGANGGSGGITTSTDGITWTKRTTPTTSSDGLFDVAFGNGNYVAIGDNNTKNGYFSSDGATWTVLGTGANNTSACVFYTSSRWVYYPTAGAGTTIFTASTPGGTWGSMFATNGFINQLGQASGYGIYNDNLYFLASSGTPYLMKQPLTATNLVDGFDSLNDAIPLPTPGVNSGTFNYLNGSAYGLLITSTGKVLYGDSMGRIYTAQL